MAFARFGWPEALSGNRFHAPVSEASLLEAAAASGLREGDTLLELACGNGAVAIFLAETAHAYVRGIDACATMIESARAHAARSPAGRRARFLHDDAQHPDPLHGPVDLLVSLRGWGAAEVPALKALLHPGGRLLLGCFRSPVDAPPEVLAAFPVTTEPAPGEVLWRRVASPLEWERFYAPQERALRAYRRLLREGEAISPVALAIDRQIAAFRAHGGSIAYELSVAARLDAPTTSGTAEGRAAPSEELPDPGDARGAEGCVRPCPAAEDGCDAATVARFGAPHGAAPELAQGARSPRVGSTSLGRCAPSRRPSADPDRG